MQIPLICDLESRGAVIPSFRLDAFILKATLRAEFIDEAKSDAIVRANSISLGETNSKFGETNEANNVRMKSQIGDTSRGKESKLGRDGCAEGNCAEYECEGRDYDDKESSGFNLNMNTADNLKSQIGETNAEDGETNVRLIGDTNSKFGETNISERQKRVLDAIAQNASHTAKSLSGQLGLSQRTVEREISFLRKSGFIDKVDKSNNGDWRVLKR